MITRPPEITNWFIISERPLMTTGKDGYCIISFYCWKEPLRVFSLHIFVALITLA